MLHSLRHLAASGAILIAATLPLRAEEGVTHYEALPSETLAEALDNFVTYNRKMEEVLAREPLTVDDMEEVHELTYTIEVALAKINEELGDLPVVLEEVHLASEGDRPERLRGAAGVYLEQAKLLDR